MCQDAISKGIDTEESVMLGQQQHVYLEPWVSVVDPQENDELVIHASTQVQTPAIAPHLYRSCVRAVRNCYKIPCQDAVSKGIYTEESVVLGQQEQLYLEPQVSVVDPQENDELVIHASTQVQLTHTSNVTLPMPMG